jgi:peptide/nickel transport system permease protein
MNPHPSTHSTAAAPASSPAKEPGMLSPSQLTWLRFRQHRLAYFSLFLLGVLYTVAALAGFFAPYDTNLRQRNFIYCPPQLLKISPSEGLFVHAVKKHIDPVTLAIRYELTDKRVPVRFFLRGEPRQILGVGKTSWRFLGISEADWQERYPKARDQGIEPSLHLLGTDQFGRDILSRLLFGAQISLSIGLVAIAVTFVIGIFIGGISGYFGGRLDNVLQRAIEIINSIPELHLWLALAAVVPAEWSPVQTYFAITLLLSFLGWTGTARVVRGKILSLREEDYAMAARLLGAKHNRIIFRHLVPGFTSHIIVTLTLAVPGMILGETALSFLGIGLRAPAVSWGVMLQDCMNMDVLANYPWLLLPVVLIVITVLTFNFLGDGLRDASDPMSAR